MSEEAVRQTRSQKRALEECVPEDSKRLKRDEEEELRRAGAITGGGELPRAGAITGGGELPRAGAITGGGELPRAGAITGGGELPRAGAITGGGELPRAGAITGGGELPRARSITGGGELPRAGAITGGGELPRAGAITGGGELPRAGAITGGGELPRAGAITGGGELPRAGAITGGGELPRAGSITGGGELPRAGAITGGGELPRAGAITGGGELPRAGAITGGGELLRAAGERNTAMSPSPDDVIVVSDEDPSPRVTGSRCRELDTDLLMMSSTEERECVINQLKEELRLEEAKLILLKKIRHSQTHPDPSGQKVISVSAVLPPLLKSSTTAKAVVPARPSGTLAPPPLVRGGHVTKHTQSLSVTPQQNSSSVLLAPRATGTSAQTSAQTHQILQPGLIRMTSTPSASLLLLNQAAGSSAGECAASVQSSVKLALRRQLEKTLLDIPPPTPLPSQLRFMPSAATDQFLCLLGLEEVVQNLLESLGRGQQGVYAGLVVSGEPSCCRQCETDFTRRWSEDGGGAILCEPCLSANQKQALKTQHTNRLKAAFVKALQQEQEIEQRFLKTTASSSSASSSSSSAHRGKMSRPPAASQQVPPRVLQASGIRSISSSSPRLQSAVVHRPAQLAVRQGSEVIRSRDPVTSGWRKRSRGAAGVTMAYMNPSLSGHKSSSALERHREFLLDMIPSHTVSHTTHSWK